MKGTIGKGPKVVRRVKSKGMIPKEKPSKKVNHRSPEETDHKNVKKVTNVKNHDKTDKGNFESLKKTKIQSKISLKQKLKLANLKNRKKLGLVNNRKLTDSKSQEILKNYPENKKLMITERNKTKSQKENKSKLKRPRVFTTKKVRKTYIEKKTQSIPGENALKRKRRRDKDVELQNVEEQEKPSVKILKKLGYVMRCRGKNWKNLRRSERAARKLKKNATPKDPLTAYAENDGSEVSSDKVFQAVQSLLKLLEDSSAKLFSDEGKDIYLYIRCFKIPITPPREVRIVLPHSLLPESPDVCLFSSDLQKGKRIDHEPTLEHVKNILSKHGITEITEVITLRQLKTEYDQYELKRALCSRFDFFLSDAKVCGNIVHHLGKIFYDRKKVPVPIKLDSKNLKKCVQTALHKTSFHLSKNAPLFNLKIGHTLMTPEQIRENIAAATAALHDCFPGGWSNVLALSIRGARTVSVPFYLSTVKDNKVQRVCIKPKRPQNAKSVIGSLPGVGTVLVRPSGEVIVVEREKPERPEKTEKRKKSVQEYGEDNPPYKRQHLLDSKIKKQKKFEKYENEDSADNIEGSGEDEDDDNDDEDENIGDGYNSFAHGPASSDDSEDESNNQRRRSNLSAIETAYLQKLEETSTPKDDPPQKRQHLLQSENTKKKKTPKKRTNKNR